MKDGQEIRLKGSAIEEVDELVSGRSFVFEVTFNGQHLPINHAAFQCVWKRLRLGRTGGVTDFTDALLEALMVSL